MYKIPEQVVQFIEKAMEIWRVELTAGVKSLVTVKILGGTFQEDALSTLLFVIAMIPLNVWKCATRYTLSKIAKKDQPLDVKR